MSQIISYDPRMRWRRPLVLSAAASVLLGSATLAASACFVSFDGYHSAGTGASGGAGSGGSTGHGGAPGTSGSSSSASTSSSGTTTTTTTSSGTGLTCTALGDACSKDDCCDPDRNATCRDGKCCQAADYVTAALSANGCCPPAQYVANDQVGVMTCCVPLGGACSKFQDCCFKQINGLNGTCESGKCCRPSGASCTADGDCCPGKTCNGGACSF